MQLSAQGKFADQWDALRDKRRCKMARGMQDAMAEIDKALAMLKQEA